MSSVAHGEYNKKELVLDVHRIARLGFHLVDSLNRAVIFQPNIESSLVADVKPKQYLNPILMELKVSVLRKSVEAFCQGGYGALGIKVGYAYRMWTSLEGKS